MILKFGLMVLLSGFAFNSSARTYNMDIMVIENIKRNKFSTKSEIELIIIEIQTEY